MPFVFAVSLFVSALLLFLVQPMIGKVILPRFGGSPAVWSTTMLFFQTALLAGYSYAHFAPRWLGPRRHTLVHIGLLLSPLVVVPAGWVVWPFTAAPLGIAPGWAPPGDAHPVPYLLLLLTVLVGLPFFVLSTSAPLLQKWFAGTGRPSAKDPYYLYAASNLGSMIALLGYPFLVEPALGVRVQGWLWLAGYALCAAMILACMRLAHTAAPPAVSELKADLPPRAPEPVQADIDTAIQAAPEEGITPHPASGEPLDVEAVALDQPADPAASPEAPITPWQRFLWVARAFVPSSMMLGVTTYFTTDITPMPLLWVLPLAVYLLSFIVVFFRLPVPGFETAMTILHKLCVVWTPVPLLFLVFLLQSDWLRAYIPQMPMFGIHLLALFAVALACHGELAQTRPAARHLTEFFLWISVGGVLGGLFNALIAPVLFDRVAEYPLIIALAGLLLPNLARREPTAWRLAPDFGLAALVFGTALALLYFRLKNETLELGKIHELPLDDVVWTGALVVLLIVGGALALVFSHRNAVVRALDLAIPLGVGMWMALLLPTENLPKPILYVLLVTSLGALAVSLNLLVLHAVRGELWMALLQVWGVGLALGMGALTLHHLGSPYSPFGTFDPYGASASTIRETLLFGMPLLLAALCVDRPVRFGLCLAASLLVGALYEDAGRFGGAGGLLLRERSFFGVLAVEEVGEYHRLMHGTTLHGTQRMDAEHRTQPISYYWRTSPMGEVQSMFDERGVKPPMAVLGLGTGTMAGYARPGQELWYFEIDPAVIPIARNPRYFTFVTDAEERGADVKILLGDGRLQMATAPDHHFGLILLDAFSSDAIPTHLITREALQLYLKKLAPGGIIAVHISNRHLDLQPMVGNLANELGLAAIRRYDDTQVPGTNASDWVLVARQGEDFGTLLANPEWAPAERDPKLAVWTDDFSNLLSVYRWPKRWWKLD